MGFFVCLVINHGLLSFPFLSLETNFLNVPCLKPAIKMEQLVSCAVWSTCCMARLVSVLGTMMKIQGWSSPSWLCWEGCLLSNLFLLSLFLGEVMQLFIHNESTSFLGFDRDINDFGEVWQHISASTASPLSVVLFLFNFCYVFI